MTLVLDLDETLVHSSSNPNDPHRIHGGVKCRYDLKIDINRSSGGGGGGGSTSAAGAAAGTCGGSGGRDDGRKGGRGGGGSDTKTIYVWKRPYVDVFLREASKLFELVIYTAGQRRYASPLIDLLDEQHGVIRRRYFRDSCKLAEENDNGNNGSISGGVGRSSPDCRKYVKDLALAAPSHWPERALLLDNSPCAYETSCPYNALPIKSYFGTDPEDTELLALIPFLVSLSAVSDVRHVLRFRTAQDQPGMKAQAAVDMAVAASVAGALKTPPGGCSSAAAATPNSSAPLSSVFSSTKKEL